MSHGNAGIRRALKAVSRLLAARVGGHRRGPSLLLQCRQSTGRGVREGDRGGHVLLETTSQGLCGLVCPSLISERGGEGDCVKEGEGEEGERERERALGLLLCHSPRH